MPSAGDMSYSGEDDFDEFSHVPSRAQPDEADFVAVVSAISQAYQRGSYLNMRPLNNIDWDELGAGAHFQVSRSKLSFEVVSATTREVTEKVLDQFVIKRIRENPNRATTRTEHAKFIRELKVLHQLHGQPHIVTLKGVAWFYEHDDGLRPCPKPVLLLEKASITLGRLVTTADSLHPDLTMNMVLDIAAGLQAMHREGIVHGDLKPENVLLFPHVYHADRTYEGFTAKISDFSNASWQPLTDGAIYYTGGTRGYVAPELPGELPWDDAKLTDVWSLGMLITVVVSGSFRFCKQAQSTSVDQLISMVHEFFRLSVENSAMSLERSLLMRDLCSCTLQKQPQQRSLDRLVRMLRDYTERPGVEAYERGEPCVEIIPRLADEQITISYQHFKPLSGSVKTAIKEALQTLVCDMLDPRRSTALFELAVISLSKYENPLSTVSEGLDYLRRSAELNSPKDTRPKALYCRIYAAFSDHALIESPGDEEQEWLFEAAVQGHRTAFEDLLGLDSERAELAWRLRADQDWYTDYMGKFESSSEFDVLLTRL